MGIDKYAEQLGTPDIKLNGLQIWVHGRQFPEANDYWDGNWLRITAHCGTHGADVWMPTFRHPISIRIAKTRAGYFLFAKGLSGEGGYKWGRLNRRTQRRLNQTEWQGLVDLLDASSFWTLAPNDEEPKPDEKGAVTVCLDGTSWYLEGVKGSDYQAVDRYCPASKTFKAVGLYMLKLSGLGIPESDVL